MNTLFPLITEYNEEFKEYYTYRQVFFKWNINSEAYHLHKRYTDFPDSTYYWVYPKGEEPKERHVLFGTYYIQHEIWKHQFPETCEDKKFLIVPLWYAGMGSILHIMSRSFSWALESGRIMIVKRMYKANWGDPEFCDADNQSILCYLQPMTNCTVSEEDVQRAFNNNTSFVSPTHAHVSNFTDLINSSACTYIFIGFDNIRKFLIPSLIHNFLLMNKISYDEQRYWFIQASAFITRLNERTVNWIHEYEKENCKECKNEYDISLYIRHGDKHKEMTLIDADVYKEAIKIITTLGMKKNYTVYVNGDDQESVDVIHTLKDNIVSLNRSRLNYGFRNLTKQYHIALISFADLFYQIRADHCVGTIGSNWNRLIYELKMTVGMRSDGFILEVGRVSCISSRHCIIKKKNTTNRMVNIL